MELNLPPPVITLGFPLLPAYPFLLEAHPKGHTVARARLPPNPQHRIIYSELRNYIHYNRISRRKGRVRGLRHLRSAGHDRVVVYLSPERRCLLISCPPPQRSQLRSAYMTYTIWNCPNSLPSWGSSWKLAWDPMPFTHLL